MVQKTCTVLIGGVKLSSSYTWSGPFIFIKPTYFWLCRMYGHLTIRMVSPFFSSWIKRDGKLIICWMGVEISMFRAQTAPPIYLQWNACWLMGRRILMIRMKCALGPRIDWVLMAQLTCHLDVGLRSTLRSVEIRLGRNWNRGSLYHLPWTHTRRGFRASVNPDVWGSICTIISLLITKCEQRLKKKLAQCSFYATL